VERLPLVADVALDGFDQVRNQVVAAFELDVDLGESVLEAVRGDHQPVVDAQEPEPEQQPDAQEHEKRDDEGTHWPCLRREDRMRRSGIDLNAAPLCGEPAYSERSIALLDVRKRDLCFRRTNSALSRGNVGCGPFSTFPGARYRQPKSRRMG